MLIPQHPRQQPYHSIYHHQGGEFAAREYIVAYGDFAGDVVADPIINALVMACNKEEILAQGEAIEEGLGELFPVGGKVDDFIVCAVSGEVP